MVDRSGLWSARVVSRQLYTTFRPIGLLQVSSQLFTLWLLSCSNALLDGQTASKVHLCQHFSHRQSVWNEKKATLWKLVWPSSSYHNISILDSSGLENLIVSTSSTSCLATLVHSSLADSHTKLAYRLH